MTLLISWLLIAGFEMNGILYVLSFLIWIGHLIFHSSVDDKSKSK